MLNFPIFQELELRKKFKFERQKAAEFSILEKPAYIAESINWARDEKKIVCTILQELHKLVPGLINLASAAGPIGLQRVKSIVYENGNSADALAGKYRLLLSDSFFLSQNKNHVLAHELTHLADNGHFAAYSKEWIDLAEPILIKYGERKTENIETLSLQNVWPSQYGCANLVEALAEYVASYANQNYFNSKKEFEEKIAPMIISPSPDLIRWKVLVAKAQSALSASPDTNYALSNFEEATKLFPDHFFPYSFLAGISAASGDLAKTIFYTEKMLTVFYGIGSSLNLEKKYVASIVNAFANSQSNDVELFASWLSERQLAQNNNSH